MAQFDAEESSPKFPSLNSSQSTASSCATPWIARSPEKCFSTARDVSMYSSTASICSRPSSSQAFGSVSAFWLMSKIPASDQAVIRSGRWAARWLGRDRRRTREVQRRPSGRVRRRRGERRLRDVCLLCRRRRNGACAVGGVLERLRADVAGLCSGARCSVSADAACTARGVRGSAGPRPWGRICSSGGSAEAT